MPSCPCVPPIFNRGIGLVVVDVVTGRHASLHAALLNRLLTGAAPQVTADLYAVAYRPIRTQ